MSVVFIYPSMFILPLSLIVVEPFNKLKICILHLKNDLKDQCHFLMVLLTFTRTVPLRQIIEQKQILYHIKRSNLNPIDETTPNLQEEFYTLYMY